jgi:hypothetical protein
VILRDPQSTKCLTNPIHLNRLKMAYVREPTRKPYFLGKVVTCENNPQVTRDSIQSQPVNNEENQSRLEIKLNGDVELRRSCRNRKPPDRHGYPVDLHVIPYLLCLYFIIHIIMSFSLLYLNNYWRGLYLHRPFSYTI